MRDVKEMGDESVIPSNTQFQEMYGPNLCLVSDNVSPQMTFISNDVSPQMTSGCKRCFTSDDVLYTYNQMISLVNSILTDTYQ